MMPTANSLATPAASYLHFPRTDNTAGYRAPINNKIYDGITQNLYVRAHIENIWNYYSSPPDPEVRASNRRRSRRKIARSIRPTHHIWLTRFLQEAEHRSLAIASSSVHPHQTARAARIYSRTPILKKSTILYRDIVYGERERDREKRQPWRHQLYTLVFPQIIQI